VPLLDHFHAPLAPGRRWESFHVNWTAAMADALNEQLLPDGFIAEEHTNLEAVPDRFEVFVFNDNASATLVAAIELVSPGNKDFESNRRAFAVKCVSLICRGVSLIIIDIVTNRLANLHNEIMALLGRPDARALPLDARLYSAAYQPQLHGGGLNIDIWPECLAVCKSLPILPMRLNAEVCLRLDLEATYIVAWQRRRLG
jgi:hypothetical protein